MDYRTVRNLNSYNFSIRRNLKIEKPIHQIDINIRNTYARNDFQQGPLVRGFAFKIALGGGNVLSEFMSEHSGLQTH